MKDYRVNVFHSEEDACYIDDNPDLRYCSACGANPEKSARAVQIAKDTWLEAVREQGKRIPKPRYLPVNYQAPR
jgi:predicted RNase H-like HicB family nuclease